MTPQEVLYAVTMGSAETIGRQDEIGSLTPGKYADLVILQKNPLDDIRNTQSVVQVMKNGRLYEAITLDEIYPTPSCVRRSGSCKNGMRPGFLVSH
ncbi:MAG: amidohydrolase family protein [Rhodanobacter sp.]